MSIFGKLFATGRRPLARRQRLATGLRIEHLEQRDLLSASGKGHAVAAEISTARAVPRIDVAGNDYTFGDGIGGMVITQNGLNIHGVITRPGDSPNGDFDASFKTDKSKTAKGTASFILDGDQEPTFLNFKIKFKLFDDGGINFHYRYRKLRNPV